MYAVVYTARFVSTVTDELYLVSFGYTAGNAVFVSSMYSIKDLITCIKTCKISKISLNTRLKYIGLKRHNLTKRFFHCKFPNVSCSHSLFLTLENNIQSLHSRQTYNPSRKLLIVNSRNKYLIVSSSNKYKE